MPRKSNSFQTVPAQVCRVCHATASCTDGAQYSTLALLHAQQPFALVSFLWWSLLYLSDSFNTQAPQWFRIRGPCKCCTPRISPLQVRVFGRSTLPVDFVHWFLNSTAVGCGVPLPTCKVGGESLQGNALFYGSCRRFPKNMVCKPQLVTAGFVLPMGSPTLSSTSASGTGGWVSP